MEVVATNVITSPIIAGNKQTAILPQAYYDLLLRKHSEIIQGTFREHLANIQGTCLMHDLHPSIEVVAMNEVVSLMIAG